jgi:HlyD family secretion protein
MGAAWVASIPDESERVVVAGAPLLEIAGAGGIEVVFDILSEDAVRVQAGNEVIITGWGGDGTLGGRVRTVTLVGYTRVSALGVEEQRVDVIADLHEVPSTLGVGYRVAGEIVLWSGVDVLRVPSSALFRDGDAWHVFVAEDGRARRRTVTIDHRNEDAAEVLEGLAVGEQVILFPPEGVGEGSSIRVVPAVN